MSIPILAQVYEETRRLAVAGSVVAGGDFRLKKLIAPLEQAGAKAPVFARIAQAATAVVEAKEQTSADALLDLVTLVGAVLYTQGETGADGPLQPIETVDLAAPSTLATARTLKPLLDALTSTGSGRLELVRDAHASGSFRDVRLVQPALHALDDVYGELADFVANDVLPRYGKAILPLLRSRFDPKGKGGDARRLGLMHRLDAAGTRPLVTEALDAGSKEVRVAAIACLGAQPEDLRYLLEQAASKSQEVRQAAYQALAALDNGDAVAVLEKVLSGKDLDLAARALGASRSERLVQSIVASAEGELAAALKTKDKEAAAHLVRLRSLMYTLTGRNDATSEAFLLRLFEQRDALVRVKATPVSGADINTTVVGLLEQGTPKLRQALAAAHATVFYEHLPAAFRAARKTLPAAVVFETFSPYLTAKVEDKKKRGPAWARREALAGELGGFSPYARYAVADRDEENAPPLDPRWLDIAVSLGRLDMVAHLSRPGHAGAERFLSEEITATLKRSKALGECFQVVAAMARMQHPGATDAVIAALEKHGTKAAYDGNWFCAVVSDLPASALPRLEALVPKLHDYVANALMGHLQALREKASS